MAQKGMWNLAREKILRERGALQMEEGDATREYMDMHEENFLSSWLREDGREKDERTVDMSNENEEERGEKRRREGEKEENETVTVKRRCDGFVSVESSAIFSQGRDLESCGDLSWEDLLDKPEDLSGRESEAWVPVPVMPDVTDVPDSPSSVVTEFCGGFSCCLDWEFVEPQSFSFSQSCTVTQEEMWFEGPQVKAPPQSRRRMMPPTPLQNSYSSFEEEQGHFEVEDQMWSARDRTIIAKDEAVPGRK